MAGVNPIASVDGVAIPCPSSYQYLLEDVSAADAGRTEDCVMHKMRVGQTIALELSWRNVPTNVVSQVLQAFQPEYVSVRYLDALSGAFKTDIFYVGNRTAPMYNATMGLWSSLSFKLIDKNGAKKAGA